MTTVERQEIQLCLNCPAPECSNCLDSPHKPGQRPETTKYTRVQLKAACRELLKHHMKPHMVATLVGCPDSLARLVRDEMRAEGVL